MIFLNGITLIIMALNGQLSITMTAVLGLVLRQAAQVKDRLQTRGQKMVERQFSLKN